jgi:hypothetical protein
MERCLPYKRAEDLWRVDRYLNEPRTEPAAPLEKAALPYEESLLGAFAKTHQRGFLAADEALRRIVESPGAKERAADAAIAAFDRQSDAMIKFSGKRKLFLFLAAQGVGRVDRHIARLRSYVASERITLHGIALKGAAGLEDFRELCLASEGGTFAELMPADVPGEVERLYAQSVNRFEVTYRAPEQAARAGVDSNYEPERMRAGGVFVLSKLRECASRGVRPRRAASTLVSMHGCARYITLTGAESFANVALYLEPALAHFTQELLFLAAHLDAAFEGLAVRFPGRAAAFFARAPCFLTRHARFITPVIPGTGVRTGDGTDGRTRNQHQQ